MARNRRGKMALYEVMSKARFKPGYGETLEKVQPEKPGKKPKEEEPITETTETIEETSAEEVSQTTARWWRKPRLVQFNAGKIEFSMPYQIAIAAVLFLIVLILAAFRFGQFSHLSEQGPSGNPTGKNIGGSNAVKSTGNVIRSRMETLSTAKKTVASDTIVEPVKSTGNNVIVLVEHRNQADLVPVQTHFAENGILTEIVNWGGKFFLITKDKYTGFTAGSDGYNAKEKIIEVGAQYKGKAPEGFEAFAPHYFSDAYGRKIE